MLYVGVVLLIGGAAGFFASAPKMDIVRSGLGQIAAVLSSNKAQEFQMWQAIYYASIAAMVVGAVLAIVGGIQKAQGKHTGE